MTDDPDDPDDRSGRPADWTHTLLGAAGAAARHVRAAGRRLERMVDRDPMHVVAFRSYAAADRALILGRVLQDEGIAPASPANSRWRNFVDAIKRIEADPEPYAVVRAHIAGEQRELVADDEGFIREWVPLRAPLGPAGWNGVTLEMHDPPARAVAPVLAPSANAQVGIISDMDDTVLQSRITNFLRAARLLLLENARTRLPFPGVAAFYRALVAGVEGGAANPIFYVSSSPWNLYDVIADFLEAQEIPAGPLLLRDWDLLAMRDRHRTHKHRQIGEILASFPALRFILIGDSGQEDPEIYTAFVREQPERIAAIYIRNVTRDAGRAAAIGVLAAEVHRAGVPLLLADDTLAAARHAAEHGWIADGALAGIGEEKGADEGRHGTRVETPGVDTERAPTLVVDEDGVRPPRRGGTSAAPGS